MLILYARELIEQLRRLGLGETNASVGDGQGDHLAISAQRHINLPTIAIVLDRVRNEVVDDDLDLASVGMQGKVGRAVEGDGDAVLGGFALEELDRRCH